MMSRTGVSFDDFPMSYDLARIVALAQHADDRLALQDQEGADVLFRHQR